MSEIKAKSSLLSKSHIEQKILLILSLFAAIYMLKSKWKDAEISTKLTMTAHLNSRMEKCTAASLIFTNKERSSTKCFSERWNPILKKLGLYETYSKMEDSRHEQSAFVTGISSGCFTTAIQVVVSFAKVRKNKSLIVYDLGLRQDQVDYLSKLPFIVLKKFNFHKYPKHVRKLKNYRWKPLIIAEELIENPSLWWLDASTQFSVSGLPNVSVIESPIVLFDDTGHSIYTATHPDMFQYLHLSLNRSQTLTMFGANLIYVRGTISVKRDVMRWWVLCALEADCMAPKQSRLWCTQERRYDQYANCHRFDQSAINIILASLFNYETTKYRFADTVAVSRNNSFPFISRGGANDENDLKNLIASVKRRQSTMTTGTELASLQQRHDKLLH